MKKKITAESVAKILSDNQCIEYIPGTTKARYYLHFSIVDDEFVSHSNYEKADYTVSADRDITEYINDPTPERLHSTEILEDESFRVVCEEIVKQIWDIILMG